MNERIRNLVGHSKADIIEPEHAKIGEVPEVTFSKYSDLEEFAEMIVRECMEIADTYQNRGGNCYVDNMIQQHFGLKR